MIQEMKNKIFEKILETDCEDLKRLTNYTKKRKEIDNLL